MGILTFKDHKYIDKVIIHRYGNKYHHTKRTDGRTDQSILYRKALLFLDTSL